MENWEECFYYETVQQFWGIWSFVFSFEVNGIRNVKDKSFEVLKNGLQLDQLIEHFSVDFAFTSKAPPGKLQSKNEMVSLFHKFDVVTQIGRTRHLKNRRVQFLTLWNELYLFQMISKIEYLEFRLMPKVALCSM